MNSLNPRPFYFSQIRVHPGDENNVWVLGIQLYHSEDGGKAFANDGAPQIHVDHHALWINPSDPDHMILGNDGGVSITFDRGKHWDFRQGMALAQFYGIATDQRQPYWIYGGLQDNGTWAFPSLTRSTGGLTNDQPFKLGGGDGFLCEVDPNDNDTVYFESQNGGLRRINLKTGAGSGIARPPGAGRNSGLRFNWETPFQLSPFNSRILYYAGNRLIRSVDQGRTARFLSEDLTSGGRAACTTLSVSAAQEGLIWVGTEDGRLWKTSDDGGAWTDLSKRIPILEELRWVSHIETSPHDANRAYVVIDGHRVGNIRPAVFKTVDGGESFTDVSYGLPYVSTRVLREDPSQSGLLYVGHETGVSVSLDEGAHWASLGQNLPVVPVHDLRIQQDAGELVAGTHGRGAWVVSTHAVQQLAGQGTWDAPVLLLPSKATLWERRPGGGRFGDAGFRGDNQLHRANIAFWLPATTKAETEYEIRIENAEGEPIRTLTGKGYWGLNNHVWDLRSRRRGRGGGRRGRAGSLVDTGQYKVTLTVGESTEVGALRVVRDPVSQVSGDQP